MMTLPLAEFRNRLSALVDEVTRTHETVTITRNGAPAAVVIAAEDYESIVETLALLGDPNDQERLAEAEASIAAGEVTSGDEMAELMRQRTHREGETGAS